MKDCKTFWKLQEAAVNKKAEAKKGKVMKGTQTMHLQRLNKETMELRKVKTSQAKDTTMMEDISRPKCTSQQ
jgi:hypothetical protein